MGSCFHWTKCKVVNEARICYQGQYWDVNFLCLLHEVLKLKVVDWCLPVKMKEGISHNTVRTMSWCTILLKMWYNDVRQHVVKDTRIKGPGDIKHQDILSDYMTQEDELCYCYCLYLSGWKPHDLSLFLHVNLAIETTTLRGSTLQLFSYGCAS